MEIILFASNEGGAGQSTVCRFFAEHYAVTERKRVLAVELGMFYPSFGRLYPLVQPVSPKATIDNLLLQDIPEHPQVVQDYVQKTEIENLDVIRSVFNGEDEGIVSRNGLYRGKRDIRKLSDCEEVTCFISGTVWYAIEELKNQYDIVLVDTSTKLSRVTDGFIKKLIEGDADFHAVTVSPLDFGELMGSLINVLGIIPEEKQIEIVINPRFTVPDEEIVRALENRRMIDCLLNLDDARLAPQYQRMRNYLIQKGGERLSKIRQLYMPYLAGIQRYHFPPFAPVHWLEDTRLSQEDIAKFLFQVPEAV